MIDLTKLSPAPWLSQWQMGGQYNGHKLRSENAGVVGRIYDMNDLVFIALARNAFEVMMRRGWGVECLTNNDTKESGWYVVSGSANILCEGFLDPFTALVESDKWYKSNVEQP